MKLLCGATARLIVGATLATTVSAWWLAWPGRADEAAQNASDPDDPAMAAKFSGRVVGPDGQPLAGARIYVVPLSNGLDRQLIPADEQTSDHPVRAVTGADGRFAFEAPDITLIDLDGLPTRKYSMVVAMADGYGLDWINVRGRTRSRTIEEPSNSTDLEFRLPDDVPLQGQLFDESLRPLADARVELFDVAIPKNHNLDAHLERVKRNTYGAPNFERYLYVRGALPEIPAETRTDAEGRFTFKGLGRDRIVWVKVRAPTVTDAYLRAYTREALDASFLGANFATILKKGRTIRGVVRDADTKQPIPGMWVGSGRENFPRDGISHSKTVTDAQGNFAITGLTTKPRKWAITAVSPPGMTYASASVTSEETGEGPVVLECKHGIPFRLKVVDEAGRPVDAEVAYYDVAPNPHAPKVGNSIYKPLCRAVRQADGTYAGFAIPGPGAVLVNLPGRLDYLPDSVDPKAFFEPNRTDWTESKREGDYGTSDVIRTGGGSLRQEDYAAIVLVNPAPDAPALELTATIAKGTPRQVSLVDPDGRPIVGVRTQGMTHEKYDCEPPLRAASFPLMKLHPKRFRRITFTDKDRQLIGFLLARGDGEAPYEVRMQPWATITGRLLDAEGRPLKALVSMDKLSEEELADPTMGERWVIESAADGRFHIDRLVPGQRYTGKIFYDFKLRGVAFTNLVLQPGETRDLGDIHIGRPLVAMGTASPRN